jgi:broad specificity phosphatase PhoE
LASLRKAFARWLVVLLGSLWAVSVWSQATVFVTRHADREGYEPDPPLTDKGQRQSEALALLLADANLRHIYTTDALRSRQTAAPASRLSGVLPVIVKQQDLDGLVAKVRETLRPDESTLVVAHRSSVPVIVKALSGKDIKPLGSGEYTRLVAVTMLADGRAAVVTLRRCESCE